MCYIVPGSSFLCMIDEGRTFFSASYVYGCWWLLAAVFVSAASTPHLGAFEAGGTFFSIAAVNNQLSGASEAMKRQYE